VVTHRSAAEYTNDTRLGWKYPACLRWNTLLHTPPDPNQVVDFSRFRGCALSGQSVEWGNTVVDTSKEIQVSDLQLVNRGEE
jgi:hypothetical protein